MNYCKNCEVELDADMSYCPLCGLKVGEKIHSLELKEKEHQGFRDKTLIEINNLSTAQKQKLIWEISGIILASGILITLIINLITRNNIVWAKYNLVASITAFVNISIIIFLQRKPFLLMVFSMLSLTAMFLTLDYISNSSTWGANLGVPITVSFHILFLITYWLIRISNQIGFNIIALVFIAIGIFLICIEVFISLYTQDKVILNWSVIAAASNITISAFLFFVHYRLKKGIKLKRFFHI